MVSIISISMVAHVVGNKDTTSTASSSSICRSNNRTPKANEPTAEIQLMYPGTPQKDVALVEAEANKYLKDKLNVTLKINAVDWGQWDNKLNLMIASGEKSDIIFTAAWQRYAINVAKGAFLDLGPLIDKNAPELKNRA